MAQTTVRQRIIGNPGQKRGYKRKASGKHRKRNPGDILGFVLSPPAGNPGRKKGGSMAKAKRNRGYARKNRPHHKRKRNPGMKMARRNPGYRHRRRSRRNVGRRTNHRRRNPGEMGIGAALTNAVFVVVGALGSKLGAQAVLGTNNVGVVGYAGNAAAGGVLWFLAEKVMKNRNAANGIIAGTLVQIILRVINDYTPFGSYVANLGMGDYQMQSFVTPQVLVAPWQNADIAIPPGWGGGTRALPAAMPMSATAGASQRPKAAAAAASAAPAAGVSGLYGGGGGPGLYGG
jgi:hypothetical protein